MNIEESLIKIEKNFPKSAKLIRMHITKLEKERDELKCAAAQEVDEFNAGYQAFEAGLDVTSAEIEYRSVLPNGVPSYDVFSIGYAWAKSKECDAEIKALQAERDCLAAKLAAATQAEILGERE